MLSLTIFRTKNKENHKFYMQKTIPIIVGPTASGKSAFSLKLAQQINGEIINADSLQVYKDILILSARPSVQEQRGIPHHLYGYLDAYTTPSVASWLEDVKSTLQTIKTPLFVGGTGMYIKALTEGISPIPEVDENIRELVRQMPLEEVKSKVINCKAIDPQRLRRALEVQLTTGKPLQYFQELPKTKIIDKDFEIYFLNPDRAWLYERCDQRFIQMLQQGAIEEVKHLKKINATGGITKAIGIKQISQWLDGEISNEEMILKATQATRHYAKRQVTWFKNQFPKAISFKPNEIDEVLKTIF